jgi:lipopolysaccharide export system protein LptC
MKLTSAFVLLSSALVLLTACKPASQTAVDGTLAANMAAPYDYYMNGMSTTRFTADGRLAYKLNAIRITHYPEGDHAVLDKPNLVWYDEDARPWQISSSSGDLHKSPAGNENELLLEGNVVLTSESDPQRPLRITTESLTVQTLSRTAGTQAQVALTTPGSLMQGVGMELRMEDNHIKLLNEVRGSYEP